MSFIKTTNADTATGTTAARPARRATPEPGFVEFVGLIAFMMALISLSIDNLLPAFGAIQADLGIADPNALQYVLTAYMAGFGVMQLVYGPVSDVIGRRPTLMIGLSVYCVGSVLAIAAHGFEWLLVARAVQGMGAAAARVLTVTIVRDRFSGREMARVMSLTMMVFIIVPIFAPAIGQLFLFVGSWHMIFVSMLGLALVQIVWFNRRMPETLHPEYRRPFSVARIRDGVRTCVTTRVSIGYATAMGLMMGSLMGYLGSSQAIFEVDVYALGPMFPMAFGLIAMVMGFASFLNSRLVRRLGMRRMSHTGICGFVAVGAVQLALAFAFDGRPPLFLFGVVLAANMFLFSLTVPNFNAMAMEPLGAIAGTASSVIGSYTTIASAALGALVGQAFDGTVVPLGFGYFGLGACALLVVLWTERFRLFVPHHPDPVR
ncbi:DHA1 family bicyclomycin/chloramphenicol resistance-like MFS transporter [Inquilinus ginsengisoli]|uniref:DHA1 family bicyclomycin/chloramphenicol resistance-like MFS transporter n=1 Tax=Inquilinus ginsengisoli TaxID=363840 RepID=A0ABU1JXH9_9PROT|nr:multidrug effflux MFS transporter [Inquilinus ginsengisoli]MDR6293332.1 DHA1 family bicyclomycin/chloramphenicol resistance-like MFS transporter [Inquilinus ginsengisoli]